MKLLDMPYKAQCPCCNKLSTSFVVENEQFICLACYNKQKLLKKKENKKVYFSKYPPKNPHKKRYRAKRELTEIQKKSIRKNLEEYYKRHIPIKIIYGGCFN